MTKHEQKTCPHCKSYFECKSGDILNCQCETIILTQEHRDFIASRYDDCLCAGCLRTIRSELNVSEFNEQMQMLVVGK
ncbi:MAG: cysteine-rich CWC family protein [Gammaproteobacteria bacterium]|nr:cysteine-rich CWC family protein [Gammaproteobacteria bacterium]